MSDRIILQSAGRDKKTNCLIHPISEVTGYSIQSIHRLERQLKFPSRLQLGPGRVGWRASEVEAWIASRQRGPLPAPQTDRTDESRQ